MATDPVSAAAEIGQALLALTGAPRAAVFFRGINGRVTCPWRHNLSDRYLNQLVTPDGVNPWTHLMRYPELECMDMPKSGRPRVPAPHHLTNTGGLPVAVAVRLVQEGVAAVSTWPLVRGGQLIGAIACYYDLPHAPTAEDEAAVLDFAARAAATVPASAPSTRPTVAAPKSGDLTTAVRGGPAARPNTPVPSGAAPMDEHSALTGSHERLASLERDLVAKQTRLAMQRASLEAESRRMAAEAARLAAERRLLEAERARLERPQAGPQSLVAVGQAGGEPGSAGYAPVAPRRRHLMIGHFRSDVER